MYCDKCGSWLPENAKFCGKCGNPLRNGNNHEKFSDSGKNVKKIAFIATVVSVAVCAVIIVGKMGGNENKKNTYITEENKSNVKKEQYEFTFSGSAQRNINFGTDKIEDEIYEGNKVVFGSYNGEEMLYRVLKADGNSLLLDYDEILYEDVFYDRTYRENYNNRWEYSDIRQDLNGERFFLNNSVFTDFERALILDTYISENYVVQSTPDGKNCEFFKTYVDLPFNESDKTDHVFLLSVKQSDALYDGIEARKKEGTNVGYWLRSSYNIDGFHCAIVEESGNIGYGVVDITRDASGVSPAFYLDKDSIVYICAYDMEQYGEFAPTDDAKKNNVWRLGVLDGNYSFAINEVDSGEITKSKGGTVKLSGISGVTNAAIENYDRITAMLVNPAGTTVFSGKAADVEDSEVEIRIPSGLTTYKEPYHLYVFAEHIDNNRKINYVSNYVDISIDISK